MKDLKATDNNREKEIESELRKLYAERERIRRVKYKDYLGKAYHIPDTKVYVLAYDLEKNGFKTVFHDTVTGDIYTQLMEYDNPIFLHQFPSDKFIELLEQRVEVIKQYKEDTQ